MDYYFVKSFTPEILLSVCILLKLVYNPFFYNSISKNFPLIEVEIFAQLSVILFLSIVLSFNLKNEFVQETFLFFNSSGIINLKILLFIVCFFITSLILNSFKVQKLNLSEYFTIFLLSLISLILLLSSFDMLTVYLLIEMQALCFYILAGFDRKSAFSTEAGLKYFITGSFISGIFLLGCVIIYGSLGTLNLNSLSLLLSFSLSSDLGFLNIIVLFGCFLITITFLFKLSAVPFHYWSPDVYEGSPLASTIIFSILPKISYFVLFIRWLSIVLPNMTVIQTFLISSGIITILVGSFLAIHQKRFKRLVIYSSIAQGGFLIAGTSVNTLESILALLFFIVIYIITSTLIWLQFTFFYSSSTKTNTFLNKSNSPVFLSALSNFFQTNKIWAASFIIIFFSLAGLPPLSGFFSKILVLLSIIKTQLFSLNLLLILISAVSVFYYLKVIKTIFFELKISQLKQLSFQLGIGTLFFDLDCLIIASFLSLLIFLFLSPNLLLLLLEVPALSIAFF